VHTHMELPFGGTFASDDFYTGTWPRRFGARRRSSSRCRGMGEPLETARDAWIRKARGKAGLTNELAHDRARRDRQAPQAYGRDGQRRRLSSSCSWRIRCLSGRDGSIFKALSRTAEGAPGGHAPASTACTPPPENGGVIDVLVKRALGRETHRPKWHALTRPPEAEGEAVNRDIPPRGDGRGASRSTSFTFPRRRH